LVGIGDNYALKRIVIIRSSPQDRRALVDFDNPCQGAVSPASIANKLNVIANNYFVAAKLTGFYRLQRVGQTSIREQYCRIPPAINTNDHRLN
jgi:hypothetical protein